MKRTFLFLALLSGLWANLAHAYFDGDFTIQKHSLEAENFFDLRSYQFPLSWEWEWLQAHEGMRGTAGSLSQERLYYSRQFKLERSFAPAWRLRLEETREDVGWGRPAYSEVGIQYGEEWRLGIMGNPRYDKRFVDWGWSAAWQQAGDYFRWSQMGGLLIYNQKTRLDEMTPVREGTLLRPTYSNRLEVLQVSESFRLFADLSQSTPAQLRNDLTQDLHTTQTQEGQIRLEKALGQSWLGVWAKGFGGRKAIEQPSGSETRQNHGWGWLEAYWWARWWGGEALLGLQQARYSNEIRGADFYEHQLLSQQVLGQYQWAGGEGYDFFVGVQMGHFAMEKQLTPDGSLQNEAGPQLKASLGVIWEQGPQTRFYFNSTWDLDVFTGRQWDGGNVQVQLLF